MTKFSRNNSRAAKLTAEQVYRIRERVKTGETQSSLSREYKISIAQIGRIIRGESWQSQADPSTVDLSPAAIAASQDRLRQLLGGADPVPSDSSPLDRMTAEVAKARQGSSPPELEEFLDKPGLDRYIKEEKGK